MSYKPTPEEISGDLPPRAGRGNSMKSQLLLVAEILRLFTDEEHGLTADEIREVVGIRTGKTPTAAKVRDDIHALADNSPFGMEVSIPSRGENIGFRCQKTFLTSEQARLAINMVQTCKFVTRRQRDEICEALFGMVSYYQQDYIADSVVVDERELPSNPDVFAAAETLSEAIRENRRVSFRYVARGLDGKEYSAKNPHDGGEIIEETPLSLVFSFGNYYAETWAGDNESGRRMTRRLDRMRNVTITEGAATVSNETKRLRASVQERISQTFDMFGEGETTDLFLKVSAWAARYVYDRFGHSVSFEHIAGNHAYGFVHVRVKPGPTFYRWLFGMGDQITIVEPQGYLWEDAFRRREPKLAKSHDELMDDYRFALEGLRVQMRKSANAYGWSIT